MITTIDIVTAHKVIHEIFCDDKIIHKHEAIHKALDRIKSFTIKDVTSTTPKVLISSQEQSTPLKKAVPVNEIDGYVTKDSMYRLISKYKPFMPESTAKRMCDEIAYSINVESTKDKWIWDAIHKLMLIKGWLGENIPAWGILLREVDKSNIQYIIKEIDALYKQYKELA